MQEGTPPDQSLSDQAGPEVSRAGDPDRLDTQSSPLALPIARAVPTPGATGRSLKDFDILLYPLSPGQAVVDIAAILVLVLICDLVVGVVGGFVVGFIYHIPLDDPQNIPVHVRKGMLFPMLAARAAMTVGLVGLFVWRRGQSFRAIGLRKPGLALDGVLGIALTFVVYGLIAVVLLLLVLVWPDVMRQMRENASVLLDLIPNASPLVFLCMAMTIGAYEELLFRGFIMPRLRRATGSWFVAVVLSSAIFTALHATEQTPAALVVVAILSVSFSLVTIWRRSIVPAIIGHALFDFSQFLLLASQTTSQ